MMTRPISTLPAAVSLAILSGVVSACSEAPPSGPQLMELCRPDTVPDQPLLLGDLEIAAGTFDARLSINEAFGEYGVHISLGEGDARRLATLTRSRLNERLPLKIGDVVISEPVVRTPILDGQILIAGNFTRLGAEDVVRQISPPCLRLATSDDASAAPDAAPAPTSGSRPAGPGDAE